MTERDPYFDLPPMPGREEAAPDAPSPAAAAADTDDLDDAVDDLSLPLPTPDARESAEQPELDETDDADGADDGEDEPTDQEWLIERARLADEYEQRWARMEAERVEREATARWDQRLEQANAEFARREDVIYQNAENSLNPTAYLREELTKLQNEAMSWYAAYRDSREQALRQFNDAREIPLYAARVVEHYKLPKEAINELLDYPADLMEREAQRMRRDLIKERKAQKHIDQLKRKAAARAIAAQSVAPGTGRGGSGDSVQAGSDDHYFAIPWTRGR